MQLKNTHNNQLSLGAKPPLVHCLVFLCLLLEDLVVFSANISAFLAAANAQSR